MPLKPCPDPSVGRMVSITRPMAPACGADFGRQVEAMRTLPIEDALALPGPGPASFVAYAQASGLPTPRLRKGTSREVEARGGEIVARWLLLDVDRTPHDHWTTPEEAEEAFAAIFDALEEAGDADPKAAAMAATLGGYATPRGLRLMWWLGGDLPIREYESLVDLAMAVLRRAGVEADEACRDWTRLSHAPRHEGRTPAFVTTPTTEHGLLSDGDFDAFLEEREDKLRKIQRDDDSDFEPPPSSWEGWTIAPEWMRNGDPIPAESSGEALLVVKGQASRIARLISQVDADEIIGAFTNSYLASRDQGLVGSWNQENIAGIVDYITSCEKDARGWAERLAGKKAPAPVPVTPEEHEEEEEEAEPVYDDVSPPMAPPPGDATPFDRAALESAATTKKLRAFLQDRLFVEALPGTDRQRESSRALLRDLVTRAFRGAGQYAGQEPQDVALSLYRICAAYLGGTGYTSLEDLFDAIRAEGSRAMEEHRKVQARRAAVRSASRPPLLRTATGNYKVLKCTGPEETWTYSANLSPGVAAQGLRQFTMPVLSELPGGMPDLSVHAGRSMVNIADDLAAPLVDTIEYSYLQAGARYHQGTGVLVVPALTPPDITPTFHADVDRWLRALGGRRYADLEMWIAASVDLARPLWCLYLEGASRSGKTMLADGVSRMFGGMPSDFSSLLTGAFNATLLNSPVVAADEGIKVPRHVVDMSERFRSWITAKRHEVRKKYEGPAVLHGHLRLIVTSNNPGGIPFSGALSEEDLKALSKRILRIQVSDEATEALKASFEADGYRRTWLTDDGKGRLVEHLAWIVQGSALPSGFDMDSGHIETSPEEFRAFAEEQGITPDAREVVEHLIHKAKGSTVEGVALDGDTVFVATRTISKQWRAILGTNPPSNRELGMTLRHLSARHLNHEHPHHPTKTEAGPRVAVNGTKLRGWVFPSNLDEKE